MSGMGDIEGVNRLGVGELGDLGSGVGGDEFNRVSTRSDVAFLGVEANQVVAELEDIGFDGRDNKGDQSGLVCRVLDLEHEPRPGSMLGPTLRLHDEVRNVPGCRGILADVRPAIQPG